MIPKDTLVYPKVWAVLHDEKWFDNPDEFKPERYLESPLGLRKEIAQYDDDSFSRLPFLPFGCGMVGFCLLGIIILHALKTPNSAFAQESIWPSQRLR